MSNRSSNMSERYSKDVLRRVTLSWNCIPSGRQLPRTPPLTEVVKKLDFCGEDPNNVEIQQDVQAANRSKDDPNNTFDAETHDIKPVCSETIVPSHDPTSLLKGMKGYQLTQSDLEFIEKRNEELMIKKLQAELQDVQRLLKEEMTNSERVQAFIENARAELHKYPSCEELSDWAKVVLQMTSPSADLSDLDARSLLAMVTKKNVQEAVEEKRIEVTRMAKMVENKKKKEAKERGMHEKQIANEQLKIQALMGQLSDLKSQLAQQEEAYKALQMQINVQEDKESKADASEEPPASKSHVERRGKERKKAANVTEKLQDASHLKESLKDKNTNESVKPSAKHKPTNPKAARGPQEKTGEQEPKGPSEITAPRLKRQRKAKPAETQSTSQQVTAARSRKKATKAADEAGEEAQNVILRRSKRLASRT